MKFKQPYYISPHAVKRFRERVADLPTRTIRAIIQAQLQCCRELVAMQVYNRQRCPVCRGRFQGKEFLIPVLRDKHKRDAWPVVPTILLPGMVIYNKRLQRG